MIYHLPAPLLAHHGAIPPQSRPIPAEKTVFAENFGFFARFCRKIRTVRPKMRRNSKAKAATMPTHIQNDSRTRNFPYLCAVTQPPTAHFHSNPARFPPKIPAFTEFSGFSRNFAEKCAPSTSEHIAAQNQRLPGRAHLRAERQPHPQFPIPLCCHPTAHGAFPLHSRPISAENSAFAEIFGFFARFCRKKRVAHRPAHAQTQRKSKDCGRAHLRAKQRWRP